ncbi:MAG: hypothetical protein J6M64_11495, partial [Oscillospiraceae bacterium]|nr:hypothetical protein [Oscillospiraceae bacterium]
IPCYRIDCQEEDGSTRVIQSWRKNNGCSFPLEWVNGPLYVHTDRAELGSSEMYCCVNVR